MKIRIGERRLLYSMVFLVALILGSFSLADLPVDCKHPKNMKEFNDCITQPDAMIGAIRSEHENGLEKVNKSLRGVFDRDGTEIPQALLKIGAAHKADIKKISWELGKYIKGEPSCVNLHLVTTDLGPCFAVLTCMTPKGPKVTKRLVRSYRWPVDKVETGIRTPLAGRYHLESEGMGMFTKILGAYSMKVGVEANKSMNAAANLPQSSISLDPEAIKEINSKKRPLDERLRQQEGPDAGYRYNEFHAMAEPMRGICALPPLPEPMGPICCHEVLDKKNARWYSDFVGDDGDYLLTHFSSALMDHDKDPKLKDLAEAQNEFMHDDSLICSKLYMQEGLTPMDMSIPDPKNFDIGKARRLCYPNNLGPKVPLLALAHTRYDPVASSLGFLRGMDLAYRFKYEKFYAVDMETDRVQWRSGGDGEPDPFPDQCLKTTGDFRPPSRGEGTNIYGKGLDAEKQPMGNTGIHWREFRCSGLEKKDKFPCVLMYIPDDRACRKQIRLR